MRPTTTAWRRPRAAVGLALAAALTFGAAACGSDSGDGAGDGKTLNVLLHGAQADDKAWSGLARDFEAANPGVKVNLTLAPNENFQKVRTARLTAGGLDVTEGNSKGATRPKPEYVKNIPETDWVRGLDAGLWTELKGDWLNNWAPGPRKSEQYKGKDYAVPTSISYVTGLYYNKDLLAKNGIALPKTWTELVAAMDKLRAAGATPLVMGGAEKWPVGLLMESTASVTIPDMAAFDEGLWTGKAAFTDPPAVEVLQKVQKLYSYAPKTFPGTNDVSATTAFAKGDVGFFPQGSWAAPGIDNAKPSFQYGYFPLPASDDAAANQKLRGKLENNLAIPASSKNKELAMKFLEFYSQKENYQKWATNFGATPVMAGITSTDFVNSLEPYVDQEGFTPTWGEVFHPNPLAGDALKVGFPYEQIAPMGKQTDMAALAAANQKTWQAAIPKG
ncbi:ABC transporter substrate-binding protein [Micromonospora chersina]|uniref:ABC transporter substrate-binding protein n=1 Tax=Micromonospora chersina TaxID=47854 RepID=UPI00369495BA